MGDRELKTRLAAYLARTRQRGMDPRRAEETVSRCVQEMGRQAAEAQEPRQGFWGFLSDVFRFEGMPILLSQGAVLLMTCLVAGSSPMSPYELPMYMPLFILAAMPAFFRGQRYRVSEIEAATRTSGAMLALARLILAGGATLLCVTALLALEVWLQQSFAHLGRMVIYCLVPYLTCTTAMLALLRRRRKDGAPLCMAISLGSVGFWRCSSLLFPWLYEASAVGIWLAAVAAYSWFFAREMLYIIRASREVDMYGVAD